MSFADEFIADTLTTEPADAERRRVAEFLARIVPRSEHPIGCLCRSCDYDEDARDPRDLASSERAR